MATIKPELKTILERYGINPRDSSQCWDCRGTLVLYHKAFEIIAAKESIAFDPPTVVRGNKDEAVIMVVGQMGERIEWSFGEAVIGQNYQVSGKQAAYPYAMAEKRAKDRVIAKLVGLAAYVHSEDEADDFKNGDRKAVETEDSTPSNPPANTPKAPTGPQTDAQIEPWRASANAIKTAIDHSPHLTGLNNLMDQKGFISPNKEPRVGSDLEVILNASKDAYDFLVTRAANKRGMFMNAPADQRKAS
jgi:hypothetical protein